MKTEDTNLPESGEITAAPGEFIAFTNERRLNRLQQRVERLEEIVQEHIESNE